MWQSRNFNEKPAMKLKLKIMDPYFANAKWDFLFLIMLSGMISGCATNGTIPMTEGSACLTAQKAKMQELPAEAFKNADDLVTVDCLLPGEVISVGMYGHWISPGRPVITAALECKLQGGQYVRTGDKNGREKALEIWQGCANQGDKVAQNYVGEIYGKSWGEIRPDYAQAAEWYRKSAEQGYSRAQNNLGFLYEHGLGVTANKQFALDLYRKALGAVEPVKLDQTIKSEINTLESKLDQATKTINDLKKQLSEREEIVQKRQTEIEILKQTQDGAKNNQTQFIHLQNELAQARSQEKALREELTNVQQKLETISSQLTKTETKVALKNIPNMGKYYALIIGINNYQFPLANLKTPVKDAKRVEKVLREKYGFETTLLVDDGTIKPTREAIFRALIELGKKIKDDDNLLIYFAGHGDLSRNRAHWLPQNAESGNIANWLSTDDITKMIEFRDMSESIKARHVLVVADSCYSAAMLTSWLEPSSEQVYASLPQGLVTRSNNSTHARTMQIAPILSLQSDKSSAEDRIGWIKAKHESISRKELTSGGLEPVIDQETKNGLSIFANAFTDALEANEGTIGAYEIYAAIGPQIVEQASKMGANQTPVYAPIPKTGDNHGEFFFISR